MFDHKVQGTGRIPPAADLERRRDILKKIFVHSRSNSSGSALSGFSSNSVKKNKNLNRPKSPKPSNNPRFGFESTNRDGKNINCAAALDKDKSTVLNIDSRLNNKGRNIRDCYKEPNDIPSKVLSRVISHRGDIGPQPVYTTVGQYTEGNVNTSGSSTLYVSEYTCSSSNTPSDMCSATIPTVELNNFKQPANTALKLLPKDPNVPDFSLVSSKPPRTKSQPSVSDISVLQLEDLMRPRQYDFLDQSSDIEPDRNDDIQNTDLYKELYSKRQKADNAAAAVGNLRAQQKMEKIEHMNEIAALKGQLSDKQLIYAQCIRDNPKGLNMESPLLSKVSDDRSLTKRELVEYLREAESLVVSLREAKIIQEDLLQDVKNEITVVNIEEVNIIAELEKEIGALKHKRSNSKKKKKKYSMVIGI